MADPFELFVGDFQFVGTKRSGKALRFTTAWRIHSSTYGILGQLNSGNLLVRRGIGLIFIPQTEATHYKKHNRWTLDYADLIIKTVAQAPLGKRTKYVDFIGSTNTKPWEPSPTQKMMPPEVEFTKEDSKGLWINGKGEILKGEEIFK